MKKTQRMEYTIGRVHGITVLKGIEVDIVQDGSLFLPDAVLSELDIVVGARYTITSNSIGPNRPRAYCARWTVATCNPGASERPLIGERDACDVEWSASSTPRAACLCAGTQRASRAPRSAERVLQDGQGGRRADRHQPDAHSTFDFNNLRYAVGQARRGWPEADDALDARPLEAVRGWLASRRH